MTTTYFASIPSPIGELLAFSNGRELIGLYTAAHRVRAILASCVEHRARFGALESQLARYFEGKLTSFDVALALGGTPFERRVWSALRGIPYGTTITYGELARALRNDRAARAVGSANAKNPISIIVPCHRVVASDGSLTGYAGGIDRKRWLLAHERSHAGAASGSEDSARSARREVLPGARAPIPAHRRAHAATSFDTLRS